MITITTNKQKLHLASNTTYNISINTNKLIVYIGKCILHNMIKLFVIDKDNIVLTDNIGLQLNINNIKDEIEKWNEFFNNNKLHNNIKQIIFNGKIHILNYKINDTIILNNNNSNIGFLKIRNTISIGNNFIIINGDKIEYPYKITNRERISSILLNNIIKFKSDLSANYIIKEENGPIEIGIMCDPNVIIKFLENISYFDTLNNFTIYNNIDKFLESMVTNNDQYNN